MSTKIAINGFGRIGRMIARLALQSDDVDLVGINDLGNIEQLAHLFQHDSVHGRYPEKISAEDHALIVGSKKIPCFSEKDPAQLPWKDLEVSVAHECTGVFKDHESASKHLKAGAEKVIISAPAKEPDITICMGVNENDYDPTQHHIISNASCTTNCLAPVVKILDDQYGVTRGTMMTCHSYTNDQKVLDLPHKDPRRARAAGINMIPTSTGAAKAVGLVLPHLKGKLDGFAVRVPTPNVSIIDFTAELKKETSRDKINAAIKEAANAGALKGILSYSDEPLVSSDFNGNLMSSVVDLEMTTVMEGNFVKVVSWYDNETAFSQRMIDLTKRISSS